MRQIPAEEVRVEALRRLGLDPGRYSMDSVEAVAATLRRTASFLAPCPPRALIEAVTEAARGLVDDGAAYREQVLEVLDSLVAYGDLVEAPEVGPSSATGHRRLLYPVRPSFVARDSGTVLLLGIAPDAASALPAELDPRVRPLRHTRRLESFPGGDLARSLRASGLAEVGHKHWTGEPRRERAHSYLERMDDALSNAGRAGDLDGVSVIDPGKSVMYYKGRWAGLAKQTRRFVARRPQAFGADRWCYLEAQGGLVTKLLDLPVNAGCRGCDEAWRLQAAIDAVGGRPQRFALEAGPDGETAILRLFSPVPRWAQRRWDSIGAPCSTRGCLLAYEIRVSEIPEESKYLTTHLWLSQLEE